VALVAETIDESADAGGTGEDGAPLLEGEVGRDDGGAARMAPADDVIEEIRRLAIAWQIPNFVDLCGAPHNSTHVEHLVM
jgi:hypothetical protein